MDFNRYVTNAELEPTLQGWVQSSPWWWGIPAPCRRSPAGKAGRGSSRAA